MSGVCILKIPFFQIYNAFTQDERNKGKCSDNFPWKLSDFIYILVYKTCPFCVGRWKKYYTVVGEFACFAFVKCWCFYLSKGQTDHVRWNDSTLAFNLPLGLVKNVGESEQRSKHWYPCRHVYVVLIFCWWIVMTAVMIR